MKAQETDRQKAWAPYLKCLRVGETRQRFGEQILMNYLLGIWVHLKQALETAFRKGYWPFTWVHNATNRGMKTWYPGRDQNWESKEEAFKRRERLEKVIHRAAAPTVFWILEGAAWLWSLAWIPPQSWTHLDKFLEAINHVCKRVAYNVSDQSLPHSMWLGVLETWLGVVWEWRKDRHVDTTQRSWDQVGLSNCLHHHCSYCYC